MLRKFARKSPPKIEIFAHISFKTTGSSFSWQWKIHNTSDVVKLDSYRCLESGIAATKWGARIGARHAAKAYRRQLRNVEKNKEAVFKV